MGNSRHYLTNLATAILLLSQGKLAIRLFDRYEKLGRRYWGRHLWSRGYCVSTIGLDEEQIRKYVIWQEKREKQLEAIQGELFD